MNEYIYIYIYHNNIYMYRYDSYGFFSGSSPEKRGSRSSLQALGVCPAGLNCRFAKGLATNGSGFIYAVSKGGKKW